jgi:3-oxoacyl-[acyl-carrier protein] reductase
MSDRYLAFANSNFGRRMVGALGLPAPLRLERWQAGRAKPVDGALLLGGNGALATAASACLNKLTSDNYSSIEGAFSLPRRPSRAWANARAW